PRAALDPPPACTAKATPVPLGNGRIVGNGRFQRAAGDSGAFRNSPEWDASVLALAAGLIGELKLGADDAPDLLSIGLSATDYVGHQFGSGGQEMCLQLHSLDRDLGDFFRVLDTRGVDYAVALTADHGVLDIPERQRLQGIADATRVDPALAAGEMGKGIAARLGLKGQLLYGSFHGDIYIDRGLGAAQRSRVRQQAVAAYRAHQQVEAVFTTQELRETPLPTTTPDRWTLIERARASFDPERSGDLIVLLRRNVTPIVKLTGAIASHGSPWDYDRRVPILFWRPGMPDSPRDQPVKVADIMPTLAAMLSLPVDRNQVDGDCLLGITGVACPPR
ncbi:MAG: alkaline phosphatase family protein, partial [Pseudomonadota bacterium]|nr:alkaline phosphatase family protein [Pseudomonadota bacterium]